MAEDPRQPDSTTSHWPNEPRGDDSDLLQRKTASDRERSRMKDMNTAFEKLRFKLHHCKPSSKKMSKIQALRFAIQYIAELEEVLNLPPTGITSFNHRARSIYPGDYMQVTPPHSYPYDPYQPLQRQ